MEDIEIVHFLSTRKSRVFSDTEEQIVKSKLLHSNNYQVVIFIELDQFTSTEEKDAFKNEFLL
jgi:hypothetical protein